MKNINKLRFFYSNTEFKKKKHNNYELDEGGTSVLNSACSSIPLSMVEPLI